MTQLHITLICVEILQLLSTNQEECFCKLLEAALKQILLKNPVSNCTPDLMKEQNIEQIVETVSDPERRDSKETMRRRSREGLSISL